MRLFGIFGDSGLPHVADDLQSNVMDWGTFWSLLIGALFATGGGYVESLLADRRAEARQRLDWKDARRLEQREAIVELLDTARQWITNLDVLTLAFAAGSAEALEKSAVWKENPAVLRAFSRALVTARIFTTSDLQLAENVEALSDHFELQVRAVEPLAAAFLRGRPVTQPQMTTADQYLNKARQLVDEVEAAAKRMLQANS